MTSLQHSRLVLKRLREITDSVAIGYSGGKDSIVMLDLISKAGFERIECFYLYTVPNLSFIESKLRWAERKYGVKIRQYPHPDLADALRTSAYRLPSNIGRSVNAYRYSDVDRAVRYDTGIDWLAYGWKRIDSLERRGVLANIELHALEPRSPRVYPLANWSHKEVLAYIKHNKLIKPDLMNGRMMSGVSFVGDDLQWVKENHPDDFARIKRFFPAVEVSIIRFNEIQERKKQQREIAKQQRKAAKENGNEQAREIRDADGESLADH